MGSFTDHVFAEGTLRAAVDVILISASATGRLSMDDYFEDDEDSDYFKLRYKQIMKDYILIF